MTFTDPLIGKKLGDYTIESLLGAGGMARVYRGYDEKLDRYAAVKVIEPNLVASDYDEEYRERFLREARSIARLNHPNVVGVYQFNQVGTLYYIAMAFLSGTDLRQVLKEYSNQDKLIPQDEMLQIVHDIADALDYTHRHDIIHRDVKPSNVIVTTEGRAVLTDFGLALNTMEGTIGNTFGSVHYIAPEQAVSSAQAVAQSDLYSLGVIIYEMLTGHVPFDDASAMSVALKHISDPPPPPSELNPNVSPEVEQVVMKALDKDPNKRYSTGRELTNALTSAVKSSPQSIDAAIPQKVAAPQTAMRPAMDLDAPTITDASIKSRPGSQPVAAETTATQQPRSSRGGMFLAAGAALVIVVVAALALASGALSGPDVPATETAVAVVLNNATETQSAVMAAVTATSEAVMAAAQTTTAEAEEAIRASQTAEAAAATDTPTHTPTDAPTDTPTVTRTPSPTVTASSTPTDTPTATNTVTPTDTPTKTATPTDTPTATLTPSNTPSRTPTSTPSNTPTPTSTPTPALLAETVDDPQILLRYNGSTIVLVNRGQQTSINVRNLVFVRFEPNEEGTLQETARFAIANSSQLNSSAQNLRPQRCLQVLDSVQLSRQPSDNPMAEGACTSDPFWATTTQIFWLSEASNQEAYFEVRFGAVDRMGQCPLAVRGSFRELRCAVDLP